MVIYTSSNAQNNCATAVTISSLPYSSGTLTTCGTVDDYLAGSYCTSTNYGGGEDYVFTYTATVSGIYGISLGGAATWKIASVHTACPPTTGNCIGGITTSSGTTASGNVTLSAGTLYYIFIDTWPDPLCGEFTLGLTAPPTCPPPTALTATGITTTSANIGWTAGGTETAWEYVYGVSPVAAPSGAGTATTSNPTALSGLSPATTYQFYVRANCGAGDFSTWAGPYTFVTLCNPMTDFFENFDSYPTGSIVPTCWNRLISGSGSQTISSTTPASGTRNIYQYSSGLSNQTFVILPELSNVSAGTHRFKAKFRVSSGTGELELGYLTNITDAATYTLIQTIPISNTSYGSETIINIPNTVPSGARLCVRNSGITSSSHYWDDAGYEAIPTCPYPTALTATGITPTSANIGWTPGGTETAWEYVYGLSPLPAPSGSGTATTNNPTNITGLVANRTYQFYVRANCGAGGYSTWAGPGSFYTGYCIPAPSSVDGLGITNVTFSSVNNTTGDEPGHYGDYSAMIGDVQKTATIPVNITYQTGYTYDTKIWIDWNDDLDFADSGEEVYTGTSTSSNPTTLNASFVVPGTAALGNHRMRIGGVDVGPPTPCYTGTYGTFEDYTVNVTPAPSCPAPSALTATGITINSANIGWTAGGTETAWEYVYGISPVPAPSGAGTATTNNPTALSGLAGGTTYQFYVRANCGGQFSSYTGPFSFTTLLTNDNCSGATPFPAIPTDGTCVTLSNQTTIGATNSNVTPTGACTTNSGTPDDDVWFSFVASAPAMVLQSTWVSGATDIYWHVFSGSCASSMTAILCTDTDAGGTLTGLTVGQTYYIRLYTYSTGVNTTQNICMKTAPDMTFVSCTVGAQNTTSVGAGTLNANIVRLDVVVIGANNPLSAFRFGCSTNGSTTPVTNNITTAKIYYTGTSSTFNTTTLVGSADILADGGFTIMNSQVLTGGTSNTTNYFWLAYDVRCSAINAQVLDGEFNSLFVGGVPQTPTAQSYTGTRTITALASYDTKADGNWSDAATWACSVPPAGTTLPININHNVNLNTDFTFDANLTVATGKTLTINANNLTMGPANGGNKIMTVNGTLAMGGGTLNINGSITFASTSSWNMSMGTLNIDPNSGVVGTSSTTSNPALNILTGSLNVTGGTINIKDPMFPSTGKSIAYSHGSLDASIGTGCTINIGTATGGSHSNTSLTGFYLECNVSTGTLELGTVIVNGGMYSATNSRHASTNTSSIYITKIKNLTVNSGSEFVVNAAVLAITGDVVNNGLMTVTSSTYDKGLAFVGDAQYVSGVTLYNGSNAQSLSGSGFFRKATADPIPGSQSGNLCSAFSVWQNTAGAGVTLNMPLTVTAALRLNGGKTITSSSNFLALGTSGTTLGTLYTNSTTAPTNIQSTNVGGWVNGPFKRWFSGTTTDLSQQGILPIGNSTAPQYAQVVFTATPGTGTLTSFFTDGAPGDAGLPLQDTGGDPWCNPGAVSSTGYVTINPGDGLSTANYTSRFNVTNYSGITTLSTARVLKRPTGGGDWTLNGTFVTGANNLISRTGMSGFSEFAAVQGAATALPIELLSFKGYAEKSANVLEWVTASESNTDMFVIERSENGKEWKAIAKVEAAGESRNKSSYKATDEQPLNKAYYRLRSVDMDGRFQLSDAIVIERNDRSFKMYSVSPNPNRGDFTVTFNTPSNGETKLVLVNSLGMRVHSQMVNAIAGTNAEFLNVNDLTNGIYTLIIEQEGQFITQRVVINK